MAELEQVCQVKQSARWALLGITGVHGVAVGAKTVREQLSDKLAIVVFVRKKKPRASLAPSELIPLEIDGVPTDVVEMSPLRSAVEGAPTAPELSATFTDPNMIAITGNDVPGGGWTVAAAITAASSDGSDDYVVAIDTVSGDTLTSIGQRLAGAISQSAPVLAEFDSGLQQVTVTPLTGVTLTSTAASVMSNDTAAYSPLVGGVQICGAKTVNYSSYGTLGCILVDTASAPQAYGLTCYHVVADWGDLEDNTPAANGPLETYLVSTVQPSAGAGQPIKVQLNDYPGQDNQPLQDTVTVVTLQQVALPFAVPVAAITDYPPPGDPPPANPPIAIAAAAANAITAAAIGVTAQSAADVITITPNSATADYVVHAHSGDPGLLNIDSYSTLNAQSTGTTVTFTDFASGVSGDGYGIYTILHVGGKIPVYGTFTPLTKAQSPADVRDAVVNSVNQVVPQINNLISTQYGPYYPGRPEVSVGAGVSASGAPQFTVSGVGLVECNVSHEVSVGHPEMGPALPGPVTLGGYVGQVVAARYDVDAALIRLKPDVAYKATIADIGANLAGTAALPNPGDLVKKRGKSTRLTNGKVLAIHADFVFAGDNSHFPRLMFDLMVISSTTNSPFSLHGDSGSVILADQPGPAIKVVGLLVGGTERAISVAVPINNVFQALNPLLQRPGDQQGLSLQVAITDRLEPPAPTAP